MNTNYAGFWLRFVAFIIDNILIGLSVLLIVRSGNMAMVEPGDSSDMGIRTGRCLIAAIAAIAGIVSLVSTVIGFYTMLFWNHPTCRHLSVNLRWPGGDR